MFLFRRAQIISTKRAQNSAQQTQVAQANRINLRLVELRRRQPAVRVVASVVVSRV